VLTSPAIRALLSRLDGEPADAIESEQLDCKEWDQDAPRTSEKMLRETVVCLTNQRGGVILLGVADRKRTRAEALVGVPSHLDPADLRRTVYDGTEPHIQVDIEELMEPEGRLLVIRVPPGRPALHTTSDGVGKIRVGKECKPLTGSGMASMLSAVGVDPVATRRKRIFSVAVGLLHATAGEMFHTSDGATSALPGALWYGKRRDWLKVAERLGEFDRQRGRPFRPHIEPSAFDGSDDALVAAAEEILRLYLWSADNHPDFEAIRAKFNLPDADQVRKLLDESDVASRLGDI